MTQTKRLMFIAWNWQTVPNTLNEVVEWNRHPLGVSEWKDKAFDEFELAAREQDGTIKLNHDGCKLIRIRIKDGEVMNMLDYILQIVNAYAAEEQKTFLFLHQSDGFTPDDVQTALENKHVDKCFLFGNGRDFIYHGPKNIGILGEGRGFHYQAAEPGQPEIIVADESTHHKVVFQFYFNTVWYYYEHEFYTKILEIRTDLLYFLWANAYPDDQNWTSAQFQQLFKEEEPTNGSQPKRYSRNRMLYLRIKNLLDDEYGLTQEERDQLMEWEMVQQKPFVFDDCRESIEKLTGVNTEYQVLHDLLLELFVEQSPQIIQKNVRSHLLQLSDTFDSLLHVINNHEAS